MTSKPCARKSAAASLVTASCAGRVASVSSMSAMSDTSVSVTRSSPSG